MFKTIKRYLAIPTIADMERDYLEAAGDRFELEYRERVVTRGAFRKSLSSYQY